MDNATKKITITNFRAREQWVSWPVLRAVVAPSTVNVRRRTGSSGLRSVNLPGATCMLQPATPVELHTTTDLRLVSFASVTRPHSVTRSLYRSHSLTRWPTDSLPSRTSRAVRPQQPNDPEHVLTSGRRRRRPRGGYRRGGLLRARARRPGRGR